ncbi:hypothetical protein [Maribellus maritimus]|uniref:hypothetical protein n=1 Tax=Maribellus maritimus TaxID=2870838 RepID=UPI001EECE835|nr:hypothetical protein [Maribellus maritimus]MCG6189451.1 hypothetical protein [Maribellus maritimus]
MKMKLFITLIGFLAVFAACEKDDDMMPDPGPTPVDPNTAEKAVIDRFSAEAGHLMVRDGSNGLPESNQAIDFDQGPFITQGIGPGGEVVKYYNFDIQPVKAAPIYALFREGESSPVSGQLNIIDVIPGDEGYNDFWHVNKVTVPTDYVANTITSVQEIMDMDYPVERTNIVVNCPVVPEGSTASMRFNSSEPKGLINGWYKGKLVFYFTFEEKMLTVDLPSSGQPDVPVSDILVTFNINPDMEGGGPPSGFVTEGMTMQTHNVVQTIPTDAGYSPLWDVDVYDNMDFNMVYDWMSASNANVLAMGVALVNCPVVSVEEGNLPVDPDMASKASIDRFSAEAGHLMVRDDMNGLPAANEPVNFDQGPFITKGLGPNGEKVQYYNFDVMPLKSAPIYVLFKEGESTPVEGQLNIIDVIPGDEGYSDFWHVHKVTVPDYYRANTVTSLAELTAMGYPNERTNLIVNCPVVPDGSTAELRYKPENTNGLIRGWYKDMVVTYFDFSEKTLTVELPDEGHPNAPVSDILVTFNINPDMEGGGPPSDFVTEMGTDQTHNVVQTVPEDDMYSPLWNVNVYDNADFDMVSNWMSAMNANILGTGVALVNCPIVMVE